MIIDRRDLFNILKEYESCEHRKPQNRNLFPSCELPTDCYWKADDSRLKNKETGETYTPCTIYLYMKDMTRFERKLIEIYRDRQNPDDT